VNRLSRAGWLDRDRIVAWSGILLAVEVLFLGFVVLWQHGVFGPLGPTTTDFVSFYAAGRLALAGTYSGSQSSAARIAIDGGPCPRSLQRT